MTDLKNIPHAELLRALEELRKKYPAVYEHFVVYEVEEVRRAGVSPGDENPPA